MQETVPLLLVLSRPIRGLPPHFFLEAFGRLLRRPSIASLLVAPNFFSSKPPLCVCFPNDTPKTNKENPLKQEEQKTRNPKKKRKHATAMSENDANQSPVDRQDPPQNTEHLNIKVTDNNNEVFFKIKRSTKLEKLMTAFCERQGKSLNSVRFLFDGTRVQPTDTPDAVCLFRFAALL